MRKEKVLKNWVVVVKILLVFLIMGIGSILTFSNRYYDNRIDKIKNFTGAKTIALTENEKITQNVVFQEEHVRNLGFCISNRTKVCEGNLVFQILENEVVLWEYRIPADRKKLGKMVFIPVQRDFIVGKEYQVIIQAEEVMGKLLFAAVPISENAVEITGSTIVEEEEVEDSLVLETAYRIRLQTKQRVLVFLWALVTSFVVLFLKQIVASRKRRMIFGYLFVNLLAVSIYFLNGIAFSERLDYLIFGAIVAGFLLVGGLNLFVFLKMKQGVIYSSMISILVFGLIFCVLLPPYSAPDENLHFAFSYRLSNAMMGQPINDDDGYIYMRQCDLHEFVTNPEHEYTLQMIRNLYQGEVEGEETLMASKIKLNTYVPIIMYLPQAIGITIARLFHMNYARLLFLGRFCNLMAFLLLTAFSMKLLPKGKWILYAICQIPLVMEVVSSYSYDVAVLSGTFLVVAYLMKLWYQETDITLRQKVLLGILAAFYASLKPVYIPVLAIIYIIPNQKLSKKKWKACLYKCGVMVLALAAFVLVNSFEIGSMSAIASPVRQNPVAGQEHEMYFAESDTYDIEDLDHFPWVTKRFLYENPLHMVECFMESILRLTDEYLLSAFGNYLGWYQIRIPVYVSLLVMVLFVLSFRMEEDGNEKVLSGCGRMIVSGLVLSSCLAVFLSMYVMNTPPGFQIIQGVQGRYLIPLLAALPFFFREKTGKNELQKERLILLSVTIQLLSLLSIAMNIL